MIKCYSQDAYDKYSETSASATIKASGGGGSEALILQYQRVVGSLCARDYKGVGNQYVMEDKIVVETQGFDGYNGALTGNKSSTLGVNAGMSTGRNGVVMATQQGGAEIRTDGKAPTLTASAGMSGNNQPVYCAFQGQASQSAQISASDSISPTLQSAKHADIAVNDTESQMIVRRLTPLECERLQGFPDGWTDLGEWTDSKGKLHKNSSDAARYKALGNSIALPPWFYVLHKLSVFCGADCTMASLFDGIGGFPFIWETINGKGTCLWASEIEEFPMAVTKRHFTEEK